MDKKELNLILDYEIIHTFVYYDFPLFFISKSRNNNLFLNYFVEENDNEDDLWLHAEITQNELDKLYKLQIKTYDFMIELYGLEPLYHVYNCYDDETKGYVTQKVSVNGETFDLNEFPTPEFTLKYDYETDTELMEEIEYIIDEIEAPIQVKSNRFKLVFKDIYNSHDMAIDMLLHSLGQLKKAIGSIASDINSKIDETAKNITLNMKIEAFPPSSFGLVLKIEQDDLFELPDLSLDKFFELLSHIQTKPESVLAEIIASDSDYSIRTIKDINTLLQNIKKTNYSMSIQAPSRVQEEVEEVITFGRESYNKLDVLQNYLLKTENEREIIQVIGKLISINASRNYFSIDTQEQIFSGRMSTELFKEVKQNDTIKFTVPSEIKAFIEIEKITDIFGNILAEKYILKEFAQDNTLTVNESSALV